MDELNKLKKLEAWARFYMSLPTEDTGAACWSGYWVRAIRNLKSSLEDISPIKQFQSDEEIQEESNRLMKLYKNEK